MPQRLLVETRVLDRRHGKSGDRLEHFPVLPGKRFLSKGIDHLQHANDSIVNPLEGDTENGMGLVRNCIVDVAKVPPIPFGIRNQ